MKFQNNEFLSILQQLLVVKAAQSCLTFHNRMDCNSLGSSGCGIYISLLKKLSHSPPLQTQQLKTIKHLRILPRWRNKVQIIILPKIIFKKIKYMRQQFVRHRTLDNKGQLSLGDTKQGQLSGCPTVLTWGNLEFITGRESRGRSQHTA